jgi:hypothetical protein
MQGVEAVALGQLTVTQRLVLQPMAVQMVLLVEQLFQLPLQQIGVVAAEAQTMQAMVFPAEETVVLEL